MLTSEEARTLVDLIDNHVPLAELVRTDKQAAALHKLRSIAYPTLPPSNFRESSSLVESVRAKIINERSPQ